MAEFKILIGENTQEATSSSSHPRLNSFCLQPWLPCAQRRAQEPEGRKPWEENQWERQIPEKPQPREGWQHTTMDVRSAWGCRPLSKVLAQRKRGKKKRGRKVQTGPGEAGGSLGFSLAAHGRAELGNKSPAPSCLRSAAFIRCQSNTKPSTTSEAKYFPEPPLLIPQASPLSQ